MSSKAVHILSGEEALNDYFTALLDEEWEESSEELLPEDTQVKHAAEETLSQKEYPVSGPVSYEAELHLVEKTEAKIPELQTQLHSENNTSYTEIEYDELEAPDLQDIQKLLDKLEALNTSTESEIETILEQSTVETTETVIADADEIQDWDIGTLEAEPVTEDLVSEPVTVLAEEELVTTESVVEEESQAQLSAQPDVILDQGWESTRRDNSFQVLYFEVNGVTFAVPLDELGGIHRIGDMSHLIGRPNWYLGLQTSKDDQLDVVDTAKWVMAERLTDDSYKGAYQYVVMLGESHWGLASTQLMGTELLNTEKVRWREQAGKRPWLAGMVKEKMCALIHVEAMILMLDAGLDVKALGN